MREENRLDYDQLLKLNTHLIKKNKQLEAELLKRNDYIADLSHRLRTPLSAIFGITSLAKGANNDQLLLSDCLNKIDFSTHMMLNIINDVLELDAVRKGNLIIHNDTFDFKLLVSAISSMCNMECYEKDIYYDVVLSGVTEESLIGDAIHLNRALMILLMRAVRVTDSGGHIKLRIAQRDINKNSAQIQFCVTDSGTALTAEEIEQYTNCSGDSDIVLVKNLCNLLNGSLSFETKKGIGTVFSMTLPFGLCPNMQIATQEFLEDYRVLLVTEDEQTLTNVTEVLKRIGTECVFVSDYKKAIAAISEASSLGKDFNLCLVDWSNTITDGIEQTKMIRVAADDKLKIATITVTDSSDIQLAIRMAGADRNLPKPLFQSTVFNLMMELTGHEYTQLTANPDDFDFSGCRVLFAEDNELSAHITSAQLEAVGIIADRTENGLDCIDALRNSSRGYYDLILLDIKMPVKDGCQTASEIRNMHLKFTDNIPIVALTADALSDDILAAFNAGMNDYVIKPIDTFQLYSTLAKYLKKKES